MLYSINTNTTNNDKQTCIAP